MPTYYFIDKRDPAMNRNFTWVQAITVLFNNHCLHIVVEKTATSNDAIDRFSAISYDGETVTLQKNDTTTWQSNSLPVVTITQSATTNYITVEVEGNFKIPANVVPIGKEESRVHNYEITSDDCFAHLELRFKFYGLMEGVHGVLGQMYGEGYVSRVNHRTCQ